MSKARKEDRDGLMSLDFNEMLGRLIQTDPKELAEAVAADLLQNRKRAEQRVADARREIDDGGRPKKGRFRL